MIYRKTLKVLVGQEGRGPANKRKSIKEREQNSESSERSKHVPRWTSGSRLAPAARLLSGARSIYKRSLVSEL